VAAASPGGATCAVPRRATIGTLKSVSGGTLTVAPPKGNPVTVKTDSATKVTKVVSAALSDVTVGSVVTVRGTPAAANGSSGAGGAAGAAGAGNAAGSAGSSGAAGTGGPAGAVTVAASQVVVLPAGLNLPMPGAAHSVPARGPGFRPGGPAFRPGGPGLVAGTVKSVAGATFTIVEGTRVVTVTTTSATTFRTTVAAAVGDLTVGQPVAVGGVANSDGSITAATIEQGATELPGIMPGFGPGFAFPRGGHPATPPTTG
jgi:hypothetical protein